MADEQGQELNGAAPGPTKLEASYSAMPEQFRTLTHAKGLPIQPVSARPVAEPPRPPAPAPQPMRVAEVPAPLAQPAVPAGGVPGGDAPRAPQGALERPPSQKRKTVLIWGAVAAVVLIGGGVAAVVVLRSVPSAPAPAPAPRAPVVPTPEEPPTPAPRAPTPAPQPAVPATPAVSPSAEDRDDDGLSTAEEELFGTDATVRDTDGDGFSDGEEVRNLYNPAGTAPARLLDTGTVYEYTNPRDGWSLYVPRQWAIVSRDAVQRELSVRTIAGEEVATLTVVPLPQGSSLEAWANNRPDAVTLAPLEVIAGKRGARGVRRVGDASTTWVALGDALVLTLTERFDPRAQYATAVTMVAHSIAAP